MPQYRRPTRAEPGPETGKAYDAAVEIRILYFEGCPHAELARERVSALLRDPETIHMQLIDSPDDAVREGMHGSPTILVDGIDPFASPGTAASWSCRIYQTPDGPAGAPSLVQIASALGR